MSFATKMQSALKSALQDLFALQSEKKDSEKLKNKVHTQEKSPKMTKLRHFEEVKHQKRTKKTVRGSSDDKSLRKTLR